MNITAYRVYRGTTSGGETLVTTGGCSGLGNVLSCSDTGLTNGQTYYYQVSAVNAIGEGARSNEASATPAGTPTTTPTATSTPTGSGCAGDGTCLTGFGASAAVVPVNTNVTLTATTNSDVGPTQWYIDIVDQSGAVVLTCSTGTSCAATVTSSAASTKAYTAWLSTSPSSVGGGGPQSNSVTVTWTSSATATKTPIATATSTPVGATSTRTSTPVPPTATNTPTPATATPTNTPVPGGCTGGAVVNGGFEAATLSGWCIGGVGQGGRPIASTNHPHSGSRSAWLGVDSGGEPNGDNCMYQNVSLSGTHTLKFYDFLVNNNGDTSTYDWQEAYWRPYGTTGCAEAGTRLFKLESNHQAWYADSYSVTGPGQIYFNVHEDGGSDPSAMYIDDVSIN